MLNKFNTLSLSFLFLMFVLAFGTTTAFAAETNIYNPSFVMTANGDRVMSDDIDSGATIDVEYEATRGTSKEYIVYFRGDHIFCSFQMEVSNNRVIRVAVPIIKTRGCTYSNESLTETSQYGQLSFDVRCWDKTVRFFLRATVTGINNNIHKPTWWIR